MNLLTFTILYTSQRALTPVQNGGMTFDLNYFVMKCPFNNQFTHCNYIPLMPGGGTGGPLGGIPPGGGNPGGGIPGGGIPRPIITGGIPGGGIRPVTKKLYMIIA